MVNKTVSLLFNFYDNFVEYKSIFYISPL